MIFEKYQKLKFFREFINTHTGITGHQFIVSLDTGNEHWGLRLSFDEKNPNIVCLYNETQNEWENNERRATYHYFHINSIRNIQKSHVADNSPNLLIKNII